MNYDEKKSLQLQGIESWFFFAVVSPHLLWVTLCMYGQNDGFSRFHTMEIKIFGQGKNLHL